LNDLFLPYFSFDYGFGKWATNKDNCSDPKKLFESITFKQEDILESTYYIHWNGTYEVDKNNKNWHPIDDMKFGHCITLNISDIHAIHIKLLVNSTLFFHTTGMFYEVTMESLTQQSSSIKLGNYYNFNLKYEYWDFSRKLHDYDGIPCNDEKGYSKDLCYQREIDQELIENFGCTVPFGLNKTRICDNVTIGREASGTYCDAIHTDNYKCCFNPCTFFPSQILLLL